MFMVSQQRCLMSPRLQNSRTFFFFLTCQLCELSWGSPPCRAPSGIIRTRDPAHGIELMANGWWMRQMPVRGLGFALSVGHCKVFRTRFKCWSGQVMHPKAGSGNLVLFAHGIPLQGMAGGYVHAQVFLWLQWEFWACKESGNGSCMIYWQIIYAGYFLAVLCSFPFCRACLGVV